MKIEWSPFQKAVFRDVKNGTGHTCVEAVAGSGKSTSTAAAVRRVPPRESVLVTSFSRLCVDDLKSKINVTSKLQLRTMNSLGHRALMRHFHQEFKVDEHRMWKIIDRLLGEAPRNDEQRRQQFNGLRINCKTLADLAKNQLAETIRDVNLLCEEFEIDTYAPPWMSDKLCEMFKCEKGQELAAIVLKALEKSCDISGGVIDYNDQLYLPVKFGLDLELFDNVFVDEFQDTNNTQRELLLRSCRGDGRMFMIGDQNQSIFGFRGAGKGFNEFVDRLDAKRLPLSISYRCPQRITKLAQEFVPHMQCADNAPDGIVREIPAIDLQFQAKPGDVILSRRNAPLAVQRLRYLESRTPCMLLGDDLAIIVKQFLAKSGAKSINELRDYAQVWAAKEIEKRQKKNPNARTEFITDRLDCIEIICNHCVDIRGVKNLLIELVKPMKGKGILLSSVHRAKGLQWNRVFLLENSFPVLPDYWLRHRDDSSTPESTAWAKKKADQVKHDEQEECNIRYVALTRSKNELVLVKDSK